MVGEENRSRLALTKRQTKRQPIDKLAVTVATGLAGERANTRGTRGLRASALLFGRRDRIPGPGFRLKDCLF
jgi:hypothetical protein